MLGIGLIAGTECSVTFKESLAMKKILLAAALSALSASTVFAQNISATEAQSPWLLRVRAVHIDSANKDSTPLRLSLSNKTIPEVDSAISSRPISPLS